MLFGGDVFDIDAVDTDRADTRTTGAQSPLRVRDGVARNRTNSSETVGVTRITAQHGLSAQHRHQPGYQPV
jgi:hypothetical protein